MKAINKIWVFALGTAVMVSCSDLDTFPESGIVTEDQKKEVVEGQPRTSAGGYQHPVFDLHEAPAQLGRR